MNLSVAAYPYAYYHVPPYVTQVLYPDPAEYMVPYHKYYDGEFNLFVALVQSQINFMTVQARSLCP
jgi:hypothetical protein